MPLGERVGLIAGCFDPFPHPGHLLAMEQAEREHNLRGGIIVCLHIQPNTERPEKARCVLSVTERHIMLKSIRYVREVVPYETERDFLLLLKTLKYDIRILGEDYRTREGEKPIRYTGDELGCEVFFADRYDGISATDYRKRIRGEKGRGRDGVYS